MDESVYERAQRATEVATAEALERARRRPDEAARHDAEGHQVCVDCLERIDPRRLAARPQAVRCLECQADEERQRTG